MLWNAITVFNISMLTIASVKLSMTFTYCTLTCTVYSGWSVEQLECVRRMLGVLCPWRPDQNAHVQLYAWRSEGSRLCGLCHSNSRLHHERLSRYITMPFGLCKFIKSRLQSKLSQLTVISFDRSFQMESIHLILTRFDRTDRPYLSLYAKRLTGKHLEPILQRLWCNAVGDRTHDFPLTGRTLYH